MYVVNVTEDDPAILVSLVWPTVFKTATVELISTSVKFRSSIIDIDVTIHI